MLLSAWLSQSKIPAEQLKIYGHINILVVRELARRARHLSARNAAWSSGRIK